MADQAEKITRADAVALWHAVDWMALCLRQSPRDWPGLPRELERLAAAKKALRKVQAICRASKAATRSPAP